MFFFIVILLVTCGPFLQMAMHLLSEKEKDDLTQLVSVMVSYALSYKQIKSDPHPNSFRHEVTLDGSVLALDPPIDGFVSFKV